MARLAVVEGPDQGKILPLKRENTLGSAVNADIQIIDPQVMDRHLRIFQDNQNQWALVCLQQDRVVEVNHRKYLHRHLEHSDLITLGSTVLIFLDDQEDPIQRPPTRPSAILARVKTFEDAKSVIETLAQTDRPEKRLTILYNISHVLSQVGTFEELCDRILRVLFEEFPADRGSILLQEGEADVVEEVSSRTRKGGNVTGVRISKTILKEVIVSKDAVLTKDAISDDRFQGGESIAELNIHSAISVPLLIEGEVHGVLYVDTIQSGDAFSEDDLKLLAAIGMQVSQILHKIRLEKVKSEKEKLERQMHDAQRVQQFLTPKKIRRPVGLDIGTKYVLSQGLGGDYYDILHLPDDSLVFVVGDVSGHNISSALVMCMCRSVIRQFCQQLTSPAEILFRTNEVLVEDIVSGMFITLFLAIYDPSTSSLRYASAGHPYPIHFRANGMVEELFKGTGGAPLGITKYTTYQEEEMVLQKGSGLFIFTDGLTEIKSPQGKFFGRENLLNVIGRSIEREPADMIEYVFQSASQFCLSAPLEDDITIVTLKVPLKVCRRHFEFATAPSEVESQVASLIQCLKGEGFGQNKESYLNLVLREALLNAMIHGNKKNREKKVSVLVHMEEKRAYLRIEDEGDGFDTSVIVDDFKWVPGESSHGRGLLLIREYVERMEFNDRGNQIYLELNRDTF